MKKAIHKLRGGRRVGAGRKPTGADAARTFRLSDEFITRLDAWSAKQRDAPSRSEAIRRLVALGLTAKAPGRKSSDTQKARAKEMAGSAIDRLTDSAATEDDKASRKRRLLKGPEEFRELRVDRPKRK